MAKAFLIHIFEDGNIQLQLIFPKNRIEKKRNKHKSNDIEKRHILLEMLELIIWK